MCTARTIPYATTSTSGPNRPPGRSSNASGTASVATKTVAIATLIPARSTPWSAGDWLASQLYEHHVHHSRPSTTRPCRTPSAEWCSAINRLTWVNANT